MKIVFMLGAGFSCAVNRAMPSMNQLSKGIEAHLADRQFEGAATLADFSGDVEAWMTHLSAEEPWLTDSENLRNRASFYEVADAVSKVIEEAQDRVFADPLPAWLTVLVHYWKHCFSSVLTFNYDEIIETAVREALRSADEPRYTNVYPLPLTPPTSRAPSGGLSFGSEQRLAFQLLKLHGSVSFYYSGIDAPASDPVYVQARAESWRTRHGGHDPGVSADLLVDKVPLIVPPTAVKTRFYANRLLRASWRLASQALQEADELHIVGYSAPESDLLVRALIGTTFRGSRIVSVDRSGSAAERIKRYIPAGREVAVAPKLGVDAYVRDLIPAPRVECADAGRGPHTSSSLLELCENSNGQAVRGICALCTGEPLVRPSSAGEIQQLTCKCCQSGWRGTSQHYYVRGVGTKAHYGDFDTVS